MRRLRILTWHVHGNYLWYLSQIPHDIFLPVGSPSQSGYGGRGTTFPFPPNVHDVPLGEVEKLSFGVILFQSRRHYEADQHTLLSPAQRRLPKIYLEHEPPYEHPSNAKHWIDDPETLLVHVTPYNQLMWDSNRTPTRIIEHGVLAPSQIHHTGEIPRGLVVINHLRQRGRQMGADLFAEAREQIPLDLVGMGSEELGGLGEISPPQLAAFECRYRFHFSPIRYGSLSLAVCEAMSFGLPIVGLATTQMPHVVENGVSGYVSNDLNVLIERMRELITQPEEARRLGDGARTFARERFGIDRFRSDWNRTLAEAVGRRPEPRFRTSAASSQVPRSMASASHPIAEGATP